MSATGSPGGSARFTCSTLASIGPFTRARRAARDSGCSAMCFADEPEQVRQHRRPAEGKQQNQQQKAMEGDAGTRSRLLLIDHARSLIRQRFLPAAA